MRNLVFQIEPNQTITEIKFLNQEDKTLSFKGFNSKIEGLSLKLKNMHEIVTKSLSDSTISICDLSITNYTFVWFEYVSTDKQYEICLEIKK